VLRPLLDDARLARYAALHAAHADLLERSGDRAAARAAWVDAARRAANPAQRAELLRRASAPT
jgi:predicted RNA polymerase sigma factor